MNKEIKNKRQFIVSNSQEHKGLIAKRSYNEQWTMADVWLSLGMEWISLNIERLLEFRWNAEVLQPECWGRSGAEGESPRMQNEKEVVQNME